jgi:uncharacterized tellurite resistance protein B-like protein
MNLFHSIKSLWSSQEGHKQLNEDENEELNHAIVELMLEMVKADFVELHAEKQALSGYLSETLGLPKEAVDTYIEAAEVRINFSISLESQTNVINNYLGREQKIELMNQLWQLAIADQQIHLLEENLFYKAGQLLGIKKSQLDEICQPIDI